ncbi:MAG: hypothetical protein ACI35O_08640, partial [Bacillaceae bacterium]
MSKELIFHEVLQRLKGRNVKVFRSGPESKQGHIIDTMDDYFVLFSDNQFIYYQTKHVQNITEDAKENSLFIHYELVDYDHLSTQTFAELLKEFIKEGTTVKINLGGPESRTGIIVDAGEDFIALFTKEDGVVFYNLTHVKSISEKIGTDHKEQKETASYIIPPFPEIRSFAELFSPELTPWVSINRGGPHAIEGILVNNSNILKVVNHHEVIFIHPAHVKSFNLGMKGLGEKIQQILQGEEEELEDQSEQDSEQQSEQ